MEWYYETDGQPQGPVSVEAFIERVREGVIGAETLVWRKGMVDWLEYDSVADAPRILAPPPLPSGGPEEGSVVASDGVTMEVDRTERDGPTWERDAGSLNGFARLGTTCAEVMLDTERCFRSLRLRGKVGSAIVYSVITHVIGVIFFGGDLWMKIHLRGLESVLGDHLPRQTEVDFVYGYLIERASSLGFVAMIVAGFLLLNVVIMPIQSALISAILHLNFRITGVARHPFETTFRTVCYLSGSVTVVGIISSVISMLALGLGKSSVLAGAVIAAGGVLWVLFVSVTAFSAVHGVSRGQTALALFLVPLEMILISLVLAVLLPLVMTLPAASSLGG